jgi:hypothetical protein
MAEAFISTLKMFTAEVFLSKKHGNDKPDRSENY